MAEDGDPIDDAWRRLRAHLNRSRSFWLGVVVTDDPEGAAALRDRARWNRASESAEFDWVAPETPQQLVALSTRIERAPRPPGCFWVDAVHPAGKGVGDPPWVAAWADLTRALNHRRDALRNRIGGLVLAMPSAAKPVVMREASDLWSVRAFLAEIGPSHRSLSAALGAPARSVFISYRRSDTGWAANAVAAALRRRLGPDRVFLDNSSIGLGQGFDSVIADSLRRSDAILVLIGPQWDSPPLGDRLAAPDDWVRREILLGRDSSKRIVPVLVDRKNGLTGSLLPEDLRFLSGLHYAEVRQAHPEDVEDLADAITAAPARPRARSARGVERTRAAIDDRLRTVLPPVQQWSGNRNRLVDLALTVLGPTDRLVLLAPGLFAQGSRGSAIILLTETEVVVVDVGENFLIRGETRMSRAGVRRVEVVSTLPLFADVVLHLDADEPIRLQGLFREQAQQLADQLRQPAS